MFVQQIEDFIHQLHQSADRHPFDTSFLKDVNASILSVVSDPEKRLTVWEQMDWFLIFSKRWAQVADTSHDYTINPKGSNACWIKLAYDLSKKIGGNYLSILIPVATNTFDPILLEQLTDYVSCKVSFMNSLPDPAEEKHRYSYVYLKDEHQLFYVEYNGLITLIPIKPIHHSHFYDELVALMCGEETQKIAGLKFNRLIVKHGGYPYFDLRNLYVGEDGTTLRRVRGHIVRIQNANPLSTFDDHTKTTPRALSLRECLRVRSKIGQLYFDVANVTYTSIWDFITVTQMPGWRKQGRMPLHVLPALIPLIDLYFSLSKEQNDLGLLKPPLLAWSAVLLQSSVEDVNCLYGQRIQVGNESCYLLDVLLDCFQENSPQLAGRMLGLAQWLVTYDASYVGSHPALGSLYKKLQVGTYFSIANLKQFLLQLPIAGTPDLGKRIVSLSASLIESKGFDVKTMDMLSQLYKQRWVEIKDSVRDYRRLPDASADAWVRLAQLISSARHSLSINYITFLMPTVQPNSFKALATHRTKVGHVYFECMDVSYPQGCLYLNLAPVPPSRGQSEIPKQVLFSLLELVNAYFTDRSYGGTVHSKSTLDSIAGSIQSCSLDDLDVLYKTRIPFADTNAYLIDILLDVFEFANKPGVTQSVLLDEKIVALAGWLCEYDASYISSRIECRDLYQARGVGPCFGVEELRTIISQLQEDPLDGLSDSLGTLMSYIEGIAYIDMIAVDHVRKIYQTRWSLVKGTADDYTRLQQGINHLWIRLAQLLSGAGFCADYAFSFHPQEEEDWVGLNERTMYMKWLPDGLQYTVIAPSGEKVTHIIGPEELPCEWDEPLTLAKLQPYIPDILKLSSARGDTLYHNYYCFLMPTIRDFIDPVQKESITLFDLSHYVLADGANALILLDNCQNSFRAIRAFSNCDQRLTDAELWRLRHSNPKFRQYVQLARYTEQDLPINLSTVLAIKALVDESLYAVGLVRGQSYDETQLALAHAAYERFNVFYQALPEDERNRLNEQRILFFGKNNGFAEALDEAWYCMAVSSQRFAQLVMDYVPFLRFTPVIESSSRVDVASMRRCSRGKPFRDADEMARRAVILFVSLMVQPFTNYFEASDSVTAWDCSSRVARVAYSMYEQLIPIIRSGDLSEAPKAYAMIIDTIVKTAIADTGYLTSMVRSKATSDWLLSIYNGTLFENKTFVYEPDVLMKVLAPIALQSLAYSDVIKNYLDDFLRTYAQPNQSMMQKIRVNIKILQLIATLDTATRDHLYTALSSAETLVDEPSFNQKCVNYLMQRLDSMGQDVANSSSSRFFSSSVITDYFGDEPFNDATPFPQILNRIVARVRATPHTAVRRIKVDYLRALSATIPGEDFVSIRASVVRAGTI